MQRRWRLDLPFTLIQQIRLAHALAESHDTVAVPALELGKFAALAEPFGLRLEAARPGDLDLTPFVTVSHQGPSTAIGGLVRPLIFPAGIADRCRTFWAEARPYRYSFAGLLTEARMRVLGSWLAARGIAVDHGLRRPSRFAALVSSRLGRELLRWRGHERVRHLGDVVLWSSERGRRFPTKAWDEAYYRLLASSAFVLCPSGDCRWSYRFFEACLCGAIPVVEEAADAYAGFRYRTMAEAAAAGAEVTWSGDDAEHNRRLCRERVTVPPPALDAELARLAALDGSLSAAPARSAPPPL